MNGAVQKMYDMAGRLSRLPPDEMIHVFQAAWSEDPNLALRCLFYIRGTGNALFFRHVFSRFCDFMWASDGKRILRLIPQYGQYEDWFAVWGTAWQWMIEDLILDQLILDDEALDPSPLAHVLPSTYDPSPERRELGYQLAKMLSMTPKDYDHMLYHLRLKAEPEGPVWQIPAGANMQETLSNPFLNPVHLYGY